MTQDHVLPNKSVSKTLEAAYKDLASEEAFRERNYYDVLGGIAGGVVSVVLLPITYPLSLAGEDSLRAGAGNDQLEGGAGNDTLSGDDGNDTYHARDASDVVSEPSATGGTDIVWSYIPSFVLPTNVENGRIASVEAANLTGNGGKNTLYAGKGNNVIDGGAGIDTLSYEYALVGTAGVTVSLAKTTAQATGGSGSDTVLRIENLIGSNYADKLTGRSAPASSLRSPAGC